MLIKCSRELLLQLERINKVSFMNLIDWTKQCKSFTSELRRKIVDHQLATGLLRILLQNKTRHMNPWTIILVTHSEMVLKFQVAKMMKHIPIHAIQYTKVEWI